MEGFSMKLKIIVISLFFLLFFGNFMVHAESEWEIECISESYVRGPSVKVDNENHPHISYSFFSDGKWFLTYAFSDGNNWTIEHLREIGDKTYTSLDLDVFYIPHICYTDDIDEKLSYFYFTNIGWYNAPIDDVGRGYGGFYSDLVIDNSNLPHIIYDYPLGHRDYGDLMYATFKPEGSWNYKEVKEYNGHFDYSLAVDSLNRPHISTFNGKDHLIYMYYNGGNWIVETVVPDKWECGATCKLALDQQDNPHIVYYDSSEYWKYNPGIGESCPYSPVGEIKYAYHDGDKWNYETIIEDGIDEISFLILDSNDHPHFSYSSSKGDDSYLYYVFYDGIDWNFEVVYSDENYSSPVLDLDNHDKPHIVFEEWKNNEHKLKYATMLNYVKENKTNDIDWNFSGDDSNKNNYRIKTPYIPGFEVNILIVLMIFLLYFKRRKYI